MAKVHQLSLLEAGCQPWNGETVTGHGRRFAYCASLAVYIYEVDIAIVFYCNYLIH